MLIMTKIMSKATKYHLELSSVSAFLTLELIIMLRFLVFILVLSGTQISSLYGQGAPDYLGGMKVTLNPDGSKYFRLFFFRNS